MTNQQVLAECSWSNLNEDYHRVVNLSTVRVYKEGGRTFLEATFDHFDPVVAEVENVDSFDVSVIDQDYPVCTEPMDYLCDCLGLRFLRLVEAT